MRNLLLLPALFLVSIAACALRVLGGRQPTGRRQKGEGPVDLPRAA